MISFVVPSSVVEFSDELSPETGVVLSADPVGAETSSEASGTVEVCTGSNVQVPRLVATTKHPATKLICTLNLLHKSLSLSIFLFLLIL
jgi:hypothetical protein